MYLTHSETKVNHRPAWVGASPESDRPKFHAWNGKLAGATAPAAKTAPRGGAALWGSGSPAPLTFRHTVSANGESLDQQELVTKIIRANLRSVNAAARKHSLAWPCNVYAMVLDDGAGNIGMTGNNSANGDKDRICMLSPDMPKKATDHPKWRAQTTLEDI